MNVSKSVGTTSPESARQSTKRYRENPANKAKLRHKWRVQSAVRSGKLKKPSKCPRCGRAVPLDFHHTDGYSSKDTALKGKWLCRRCHSSADGGKTKSGKNERSGKHMSDARKKAEATKKKHGTYHLDGSKSK